jgi:hypothetical protein
MKSSELKNLRLPVGRSQANHFRIGDDTGTSADNSAHEIKD